MLKCKRFSVSRILCTTNSYAPGNEKGLKWIPTGGDGIEGQNFTKARGEKKPTFQDQEMAENLTNLADSPNIFLLYRIYGAHFFNSTGPFTLGGTRATPSVKGGGGQNCRGNVKG